MNKFDFKTFFENNRMTTVFHVSPNSNIYKLRATGSHKGAQAVKQNKAGIYVAPKFEDALIWFLSYVTTTKHPKIHGSKSHYDDFYKNATVYTIELPKEVLDRSWFSNFWEREYFIEEKDIPLMQIVAKKTYSEKEISNMYKRINDSRRAVRFKSGSLEKALETTDKTNFATKTYKELNSFYSNYKLRNSNTNPELEESVKNILNEIKKFMFLRNESDWMPSIKERISPEEKIKVVELRNKFYSLFNK